MDSPTIERISKLHPSIRNEVSKIINECDKALTGRAKVRITQGLRTFEEQQKLYNQRPKVTNAKAGQSYHNYGLAVDIVLLIDKDKNGTFETATWDTKADWDADKIADWLEVVKVFKKYGWEWGGEFKSFKDLPHFQKTFGKTWQNLKALHDAKKFDKEGFVLL